MVVVLNQVDTVNPFAAAECAADLRRLLDDDGLRRSPVLTCSARTGAGVDALEALLVDAVSKRRARNDRLVADVEDVVEALVPAVSADEPDGVVRGRPRSAWSGRWPRRRVCRSSGPRWSSPGGCAPRGSSAGRRPGGCAGCAPTRSGACTSRARTRKQVRSVLVRSSVPEASPVQHAQVDTALRQACDAVAHDLPSPWQQSVRAAASGRSGDVRDRLDQAVVGTDLGVDRVPVWWRLGAALQWLLTLAALVGGGWLLLLAVGSYLRLPDPPTPDLRGVAVPTLLLVGGVVLGLLLAAFGRLLVRGGALARRRRAESRLRAAIEQVADELMLAPVEAELARHAQARLALDRARTG